MNHVMKPVMKALGLMTLIVGWQTQIGSKTEKDKADETVTSLAPEIIMYIRNTLIQE